MCKTDIILWSHAGDYTKIGYRDENCVKKIKISRLLGWDYVKRVNYRNICVKQTLIKAKIEIYYAYFVWLCLICVIEKEWQESSKVNYTIREFVGNKCVKDNIVNMESVFIQDTLFGVVTHCSK